MTGKKLETYSERRTRYIDMFADGAKLAKEPDDGGGASLKDYLDALHKASTDPGFEQARKEIAQAYRLELD